MRKFFQLQDEPVKPTVYKAFVVDVYNKDTPIQSDPEIIIPKGSVKGRIPGIDYDVSDDDLRIYTPNSKSKVEIPAKGSTVYVTFGNVKDINSGIILGIVPDSEGIHPNGLDSSKKENYSDEVLLGVCTPTKKAGSNPYSGSLDASEIGTFPDIWPIDINYKKIEVTPDNKLQIYIEKGENLVFSSGGGIIEEIGETYIKINHGIVNENENDIYKSIYENLKQNSFQDIYLYSNTAVGTYIKDHHLIGKAISPYFYFSILKNDKLINPVLFAIKMEENSIDKKEYMALNKFDKSSETIT